MSAKSVIAAHLLKIAAELGKTAPPLTDDLLLLDSGLDSLGMAVLVLRLEEELGKNPFTDEFIPPATLGDLVWLYEQPARGADPSAEGPTNHSP